MQQDAPPRAQSNYSMTSSASASSFAGISRPSALAVLRGDPATTFLEGEYPDQTVDVFRPSEWAKSKSPTSA